MNQKLLIIATLLLIAFTFGVFAQQYSYDYDNMKKEEYAAELAKWQKREADANAQIEQLEGEIAQLNEDIAAANQRKDDCWNEIYSMLDTDKAGYEDFVQQCKDLENDLNGFVALSADEMVSRQDEFEQYKERYAALKKDKRSLGPDPYNILQRVESLINQAEQKMASAVGRYTVIRGDYLWKIAKKPEIYGDPFAWMTVYSYNREVIGINPDLIYPGQQYRIPRRAGSNEYWVTRGDNLTAIANRYGSPFTWQRIYEANRELIGDDPNLVYPHTVLSLPR